MDLNRDGAVLVPAALSGSEVSDILHALGPGSQRAGARIPNLTPIWNWVGPAGRIGSIAEAYLKGRYKPVRAILFDKSERVNWALGWHQDRTIAVTSRVDVPGYGPWTIKDGIPHVEPPFELIERMITLRVHLDPVDDNSAPLLISPGTHLLGKIAEQQVQDMVARHGQRSCLAQMGDVWIYRTAILHASRRSSAERRRRVLQIDYSNASLPSPLTWSTETTG